MNRPPPPLPSFMIEAERKAEEKTKATATAQAGYGSPINVDKVDRNINESLRKQIVEIITKNPELALTIVRGWKDR